MAQGGQLFARFSEAQHFVQHGEWLDAVSGRSIMRSSYLTDDLTAMASELQWNHLSGDTEVVPGVEVRVTKGHTEHHRSVVVRGSERTLVYPGDLIPTRHHLRPYWIMSYDMFPFDTFQQKRKLCDEAAAEDWILAWDHDPDQVFSTLSSPKPGQFEAVRYES